MKNELTKDMILNNRKNKKTYFSKNILEQADAIVKKWGEMPDNFVPPYMKKDRIFELKLEISGIKAKLRRLQEEIKLKYTEKKVETNPYFYNNIQKSIERMKKSKRKLRDYYVKLSVELWNYIKIFKKYHKVYTGDWCDDIFNSRPGLK